MGYVETVLQPGETVRFRTRRHWVLYLPGLAVAVPAAGCVAWTIWSWATADYGESVEVVWVVLSAGLSATAVLLLGRAWYRRRFTEIAVTDCRVIYKSGFLHRSTSEMPIERIEKIDVEQGILGRILDYGNVRVNGVSCGIGDDRLRRIASPIRLRTNVIVGDGAARLPSGPVVAEVPRPAMEPAG